MAKCDLCGKDCKAQEMQQLYEKYQVPGVVDVCPTCAKWATDLKGEILKEIAPRMRAAIANRAAKPIHRGRLGWLFDRLGVNGAAAAIGRQKEAE